MSYYPLGRREAIDMTAGKRILTEYNLTNVQMAQLVAEQHLANAPPLHESLRRMVQPGAARIPSGESRPPPPQKPRSFRGPAPPVQNLGGAEFHPSSGSGVGIAFPLCLTEPSYHVQDAGLPIIYALPKSLHDTVMNRPKTFFVVDWPGYNHLNLHYDFTFVKDDGSDMLTIGEMAKQIAEIYQWWYRSNHHKFREGRGTVRVGPGGVTYEKMSLRGLCLVDGAQNLWKADVVRR